MSGELDAILGVVRRRTGVDFSRYRLATVERRVPHLGQEPWTLAPPLVTLCGTSRVFCVGEGGLR